MLVIWVVEDKSDYHEIIIIVRLIVYVRVLRDLYIDFNNLAGHPLSPFNSESGVAQKFLFYFAHDGYSNDFIN